MLRSFPSRASADITVDTSNSVKSFGDSRRGSWPATRGNCVSKQL